MRYENIEADYADNDFLMFKDGDFQGDVSLIETDELMDLTNAIRKECGYMDLVDSNCDNEVYYDFYLVFNLKKKIISIHAVCNYGEKDDKTDYELPMTEEEKENVLWKFVNILTQEIYNK